MGLSLTLKVCRQVAVFDELYARHGDSYVCLKWVNDGYELYIHKSKNGCKERLVDKATIAQLLEKQQFRQLFALIYCALPKYKYTRQDILKQLPNLVQEQRSIIFEKDGSFIVEP